MIQTLEGKKKALKFIIDYFVYYKLWFFFFNHVYLFTA